jgi:hypothetical protein
MCVLLLLLLLLVLAVEALPPQLVCAAGQGEELR